MSALLRFQCVPLFSALPRALRKTFDALTYLAPSGIVAGEVWDYEPAALARLAGKGMRQCRADVAALKRLGYIGVEAGRVAVIVSQGLQPLRKKIKRRVSAIWSALVGSAAAVLRQCSGSFGGVSPSKQTPISARESPKIKDPCEPVTADDLSAVMAFACERLPGEPLREQVLRMRREAALAASRAGSSRTGCASGAEVETELP